MPEETTDSDFLRQRVEQYQTVLKNRGATFDNEGLVLTMPVFCDNCKILLDEIKQHADLETRLTIVVKALERARLFVESLESVPILDQEDRDGLKFYARNAKAEIDRALDRGEEKKG